jgi:hypothetical protein
MNKDVYSLLELEANAESMLSRRAADAHTLQLSLHYSRKKTIHVCKELFCILLSDEKILVIIQSSPQLLFFY